MSEIKIVERIGNAINADVFSWYQNKISEAAGFLLKKLITTEIHPENKIQVQKNILIPGAKHVESDQLELIAK